jgi:hypothetical protein
MEKDFMSLCNERGYTVVDLSYHHNFSDEAAASLRRDFSPSAMSVRVSPDLLIQKQINGSWKGSFVELKTGNSKVIQMEAFQLLQNKIQSKYLDSKCLYVYRGMVSGGEMIACYADRIRVSKLVIPKATKNGYIKPILEREFSVPTEERGYI